MNATLPLRPTAFALALALAIASTVWAAPPDNLRRAKIEPATLNGTLAETVRSLSRSIGDEEWIGYAVTPRPGVQVCGGIWRNGQSEARLDSDDDGMNTRHFDDDDDGFTVARDLQVLLRVNGGDLDRIRVFTSDCEVKAAGTTLYWLDEVPSQESIALLSDFASRAPANKRQREVFHSRAISGLAMHDDAGATTALIKLVDTQEDDKLRAEIVFWMSNSDRPGIVDRLVKAVNEDPSEKVREQAIFALSNCDSQEAVDALIRIAKSHDDSDRRSNAIFWLSQKAGERAKGALSDAVLNDPDAGVKEQAVFAISQLPADEGVPLLIELARNHKHGKVREQAIFWLGQSEDPRALAFFEEILSR